jgi:UDP-N-acetylmuramoyl-L-alanyl-D-glutamate--2,6-diaminopimelate ligase
MDLDQLIAGIGIRRLSAVVRGKSASVRICDITEDSRTVMPGSLFVARRGEKSDGRAFVPAAIAAGAVAILSDDPALRLPLPSGPGHTQEHAELLLAEDLPLAAARVAERFYGDASSKLATIGVTGTNGKTTITWLVHQALNGLGVRCGMMGTVCIDDGTEIAPATLTTPPALEVSRTISRMLESGCRACVMETSSHALHQRRVGGVRFRIGVFTNLTHDHLDYHGTMEKYAESKAILFDMLPAGEATSIGGKPSTGGVAIVNADDTWHERMVRDTSARVVRCSIDRGSESRLGAGRAAQWRGSVLGTTLAGMDCRIIAPSDAVGGDEVEWSVRLPLIGAHNLMNALQACAVLRELGVAGDDIRAAMETCKAPPGRLELVTSWGDPLAVYVDYAHTDDALQRVLAVGRDVVNAGAPERAANIGGGGAASGGGRLWVVFGCGGDRDRTKRPKMGGVAAELADRLVITSDNPRTEDPRAILEQVVQGVPASQRYKATVEIDRRRAIELAVREAQPGDLIIIAGKGHEDYQILPDGHGGTTKIHFDDREVASEALLARGDIPSCESPRVVARARGVGLKAGARSARTRRHQASGEDHDAGDSGGAGGSGGG